MSLSKRWAEHLKGDDKKDFEADVRSAKPILDRLKDILTRDLHALEETLEGSDFLVLPGTKERIVHALARRKQLKAILKLIEV